METPPQVRGHHLLCLLTYVGRGYSPDFVRAMDALAAHVTSGGAMQLCVGPDVLCASLTTAQGGCGAHCHLDRNAERDRVALHEVGSLLGRAMQPGTWEVLTAEKIYALRQTLQPLDAQAALTGLRSACGGCEWLELCRDVSADGFAQSRIAPTPRPRVTANSRQCGVTLFEENALILSR